MCCAATSASVQWVAIRTERTPSENACLRSVIVPMPGSSSVVSRARVRVAATASIHSSLRVAARPVDEAGAGQAVAVGDLDPVHAGRVERGRDPRGLLGPDAVPDGVQAVAEGDVLNE